MKLYYFLFFQIIRESFLRKSEVVQVSCRRNGLRKHYRRQKKSPWSLGEGKGSVLGEKEGERKGTGVTLERERH